MHAFFRSASECVSELVHDNGRAGIERRMRNIFENIYIYTTDKYIYIYIYTHTHAHAHAHTSKKKKKRKKTLAPALALAQAASCASCS
jgi:ribosomal protein S3AE